MNGTNPGSWPDQEPNEPQMSRYTAADLAKAREEGRREALESLRRNATYDESSTTYGDGITQERRTITSRIYSIDADIFFALLGEKEEGDDGPEAKTY